ncbi:MAG: hypothetical protein KZQ95_09315 [Candidatus Thiodiazotropha sp. (ex Epidulcina cf. delphinae)]|nr:hypothetical protein [Candidatus Thiodiazotropha sp. (ex Epidulcina cf. delphinae)]
MGHRVIFTRFRPSSLGGGSRLDHLYLDKPVEMKNFFQVLYIFSLIFIFSASVSHAASFAERCAGSGVVICEGFDSEQIITNYATLSDDGNIRAFLDTAVKASGGGSLRFDIPPYTGPSSSGSWTLPLGTDHGFTVGEGDTVYIQFRQRFNRAVVEEASTFSGGGMKQFILYKYPSSCGNLEFAQTNSQHKGAYILYTECGNRNFAIPYGGWDWLRQHGVPLNESYFCRFSKWNNNDLKDCGVYRPDEWMTFYIKLKIGEFYQSNSEVIAWVAYEGEDFKQYTYRDDFTFIYNNNSNDAFDTFKLTPYNTGKESL